MQYLTKLCMSHSKRFGNVQEKFSSNLWFVYVFLQHFLSGSFYEATFSNNTLWFLILIDLQGLGMISWAFSCELINKEIRAFAPVLNCLFWTLGQIILGVLAYYIPKWRHLSLAVTIPFFLTFFYVWYGSALFLHTSFQQFHCFQADSRQFIFHFCSRVVETHGEMDKQSNQGEQHGPVPIRG